MLVPALGNVSNHAKVLIILTHMNVHWSEIMGLGHNAALIANYFPIERII